jgi:NitT/TauT family transport system permease protein
MPEIRRPHQPPAPGSGHGFVSSASARMCRSGIWTRLRGPVARWARQSGVVFLAYLLALAAWQAASAGFHIPTFLLPSPTAIVERAAHDPSQLVAQSLVTLGEVVEGFLFGAVVSIPLGILVVYSSVLERLIYPFLVAFQAIPKVALAPILVVWFGFGPTSKVTLAFVTAMFPIIVNTVIGMKQTPPELIYLMRSLQASETQIFLKIRLYTAAPYIFAGFKIGVTLAVVGAIVGEFIASNGGLGYLLLAANNNIDTPLLFAVVGVLAMLSIALYYAVEAIESLVLPRPLRRRGAALEHRIQP